MATQIDRIERGPWFSARNKEDACHRHVYWQSNCETCRATLLNRLTAEREIRQ